ncbi:glycerol-3-phosphate acyltransferase 3-like [Artemia franciscana]|uniref:glycerol-3-phosphate acyltransferase 3-like n=1 Tax=Artemia franciscana TaxID=6661 RepID=UPI0032DB350F
MPFTTNCWNYINSIIYSATAVLMPYYGHIFISLLGTWFFIQNFNICLNILHIYFVWISVSILVTCFDENTLFRKIYTKSLLWLFEYCRQKTELKRKSRASRETNENEQPSNVEVSQEYWSPKLIDKAELVLNPDPKTNRHKEGDHREHSFDEAFQLGDILDYVKAGMEAIVEDEVTQRFEAPQLRSWNFLTRTNHYKFICLRSRLIWLFGFFFRHFVLFPYRLLIGIIGVSFLVISTGIIGCFPDCKLKRLAYNKTLCPIFRILSLSLGGTITFHNRSYKPTSQGICVANHTSVIDVVILATSQSYSLYGQSYSKGLLGFMQRGLSRASSHVWFDRSDVKERAAVTKRIKEHLAKPDELPMLIFPEGTCINNTSVMQFKKGSFEAGGRIYPVAIKYDARFADPFWNSAQSTMIQHLYSIMTSWAIVCDVWYLPPMSQDEGESAIEFSNRVKAAIARQGGLVNLQWDGLLKRNTLKPEWKQKQQEEFSKRLKDRVA